MGPRLPQSWGRSMGRPVGPWCPLLFSWAWGTSPSGQAVGHPGGGSCVGSEAPARLLPNSQAFGNLGIAIPKVNSRQLASIPGRRKIPRAREAAVLSALPSVSNFPGGNEIQRAGGSFAVSLQDLLREQLDRPGRFYPSPKFFGLVCASRP